METKKTKSGKFNLHFHLLVECDFLPQPILSQIWGDVLCKSWKGREHYSEGIVDIRVVNEDIEDLLDYICKEDSLSKDNRFRNLRLYSNFGEWYHLHDTDIE